MYQLLKEYSLKSCTGLNICVTGFDSCERKQIENNVTELGGTFVLDFSRNCTHLIAKSAVGAKVDHAFDWNIPVVKYEWIQKMYKDNGSKVKVYLYRMVPDRWISI